MKKKVRREKKIEVKKKLEVKKKVGNRKKLAEAKNICCRSETILMENVTLRSHLRSTILIKFLFSKNKAFKNYSV